MSRAQSSLPSKSKPLRMPVPVIANTLLPSVSGEGYDMFCLRIFTLPTPNGDFHKTSPFFRFTHQSERLSPSATFRKIRSRQIIGVEPLQLGSGNFHTMFSSGDHRDGRFFSPLIPLRLG